MEAATVSNIAWGKIIIPSEPRLVSGALFTAIQPIQTGELINFRFPVPKNLKRLTGIAFHATPDGVANVSGAASEGYQLGFISLLINNKQSSVLQRFPVVQMPKSVTRRFKDWIPVDEPLMPGSMISGYYRDTMVAAPKNYFLHVFFKGER